MTKTQNHNPAEWEAAERLIATERKQHSAVKVAVLVFAAIGVLILLAAVAGLHDRAPAAHNGNAPVTDRTPSAPRNHPAINNEKLDVTSFRFDDRSRAGITDIWITEAITNHSSKKSDYVIQWQVTDARGVRVDSGTSLVFGVLPHQTAHQDEITTVDHTSGLTLKILSVDRTESVS